MHACLLSQDPSRKDLAWKLGLDEDVTDEHMRTVHALFSSGRAHSEPVEYFNLPSVTRHKRSWCVALTPGGGLSCVQVEVRNWITKRAEPYRKMRLARGAL